MKEPTHHIYLDSNKRTLLLHSLVELKNVLLGQGRYTDCVDKLNYNAASVPAKKMKIEYI